MKHFLKTLKYQTKHMKHWLNRVVVIDPNPIHFWLNSSIVSSGCASCLFYLRTKKKIPCLNLNSPGFVDCSHSKCVGPSYITLFYPISHRRFVCSCTARTQPVADWMEGKWGVSLVVLLPWQCMNFKYEIQISKIVLRNQ